MTAEISVFRPGDVSYLRIAAPDPVRSAAFYSAVFGWQIRADSSAFQDATGIGIWQHGPRPHAPSGVRRLNE